VFADRLSELERRLEAEPAVVGATITGSRLTARPLLLIEGVPGPAEGGAHWVQSSGVASDYFELLGARMLAGRALRAADAESDQAVVVNAAFVRRILGGESAVGRRVRFVPLPEPDQTPEQVVPGPWLEIVGVVEDLVVGALGDEDTRPKIHYAVAPGQLQSAGLLVHIRNGDTNDFAPRLRRIAAAVDPDLRLAEVGNLYQQNFNDRMLATIALVTLLVLAVVVLLSAAGIHALMSLTVTRRRREIGIRTALGARPARLLAGIFSRAAWQLGIGGLVGSTLALKLLGWPTPGAAVGPLGSVLGIMLLAGLIAAIPPARRGLRIQPLEALKEE
jgi:hypothetical protein